MLTFRRALLISACVLTIIYLFHSPRTPSPLNTGPAESAEVAQASGAGSTPKEQKASSSDKSSWSWKTSQGRTQVQSQQQQQQQQQPITDVTQLPLRDQLSYQFPYDVSGKFPAYIWQTWKYTPASGEFAEEFRPNEASWSIKHPGFVHEVVTDKVAVHLMRHLYASVPPVYQAYEALPLSILKADFFRYLILLARGGIYSDIDTYANKSAAEWVPQNVPRSTFGLVVGIEADPDREDWAVWYSRRIQFCQWTIQAKPGHPVLREVVANITEETLKRKADGTLKKNTKSIVEFTGPALWTDKIFDYLNDEQYFDMSSSPGNITWKNFTGITEQKKVGDVVILPITSFSPGIKTMGAGDDDDPMAFVKHGFHGSWKPESERHIGEENNEN